MGKRENRVQWVKNFEAGRRWLNGVEADHGGSMGTQYRYARVLYEFCQEIKKDPDQLISERKKELESKDMMVRMRAEEIVRDFTLTVRELITISFRNRLWN